jgi:hypothetical protein
MRMRRTFALVPSTIALIVVALLATSAGIGVSLAGEARAVLAAARKPANATVDRADGRASVPDGRARTLFLHAQPTSTGRLHAPHANGDGGRSAAALDVARASLDVVANRTPGAAVDARERGVTSPGQPAPSSRAPPIG